MEEKIASTEGTTTALDGANIRHKDVTTATRTKLVVVVGPLTTAIEMGTHSYVLHSLLGGVSLVVEAILPLVNCIDRNRTEWVRLMADQETMTRFAYDVPWIILAYLNTCILTSTVVAEGDPGARTLVTFQYLIDELENGWYTGRALLKSLQDLLIVRVGKLEALALAAALPLLAPRTLGGDGRAIGGGGGGGGGGGRVILPRGWRWNERNREVIPNPCPIQRLRILSGENTRGMLWDVALPTLGGVAFCKRWHMGYTCFGDFLRAASHLHSVGDIVDELEAAMATDRAARAASAVPT